MLDRFKVPEADQVRIPEPSLRQTVEAIFEKMGVSAEDSKIGADVLVTADLRGVETHGVSNMLRMYVQQYTEGDLNPRPVWKIDRESPSTATIDGDKGLAVILGPKAMRVAMAKAKKVGTGAVTMHNTGHSGPIGHHAMLAAQEDMIGIAMTSGGVQIAPTFASEARYGTNPIAMAAPGKNEAPFLFDVATSTVAGNKLNLAKRIGADLLPGWIADRNGVPNAESVPVPEKFEDFYLLPLGGTREHGSHKGYGFGMMVEIMGALLSGGTPHMLDSTAWSQHYFSAYNIEAFTDLDDFKDKMDRTLKTLRTTKPAPGHERVMYPGLSEYEEETDRRANGIPLHSEVVEWFDKITSELNLPRLERVGG
jgi:L-2-hydroxycarboxylate dehydrogenase (NAD+)